MVLKATSFGTRKERVRGWWQEGQGQEVEEGLAVVLGCEFLWRREGSFIFLPMGNEMQIQMK